MLSTLSDLITEEPPKVIPFSTYQLIAWMVKKNFYGSLRNLNRFGPESYRYERTEKRAKVRQDLVDLGLVEVIETPHTSHTGQVYVTYKIKPIVVGPLSKYVVPGPKPAKLYGNDYL